jgi:transcriptional regulator with XRE-family HTH domain
MINPKESGHTIMFNMTEVGRKISQLRKKANLTQMELADKLDISFQAVSNWERGRTMPDISKLSELSDIFDVSIDELLQNDRAYKMSKSIIDDNLKNEKISVEELEEFAPILKPDQVEEIVENVYKDMSVSNVVKLAPFLSQEFIDDYASGMIDNMEKVSELLCIAPFVSKTTLDGVAIKILEEKGLKASVTCTVS